MVNDDKTDRYDLYAIGYCSIYYLNNQLPFF